MDFNYAYFISNLISMLIILNTNQSGKNYIFFWFFKNFRFVCIIVFFLYHIFTFILCLIMTYNYLGTKYCVIPSTTPNKYIFIFTASSLRYLLIMFTINNLKNCNVQCIILPVTLYCKQIRQLS